MSKLLEQLHEIFPPSRTIGDEFHLTADAVLASLASVGTHMMMTSIPAFSGRDLDDDELSNIVFDEYWDFHKGRLIIHSPACSRYDLPDFECAADKLRDFIQSYNREMLFDGDVLFLGPDSKTLSVFHHEGAFGHCYLPTHCW